MKANRNWLIALILFSFSCNFNKGKVFVLNTNFGEEVARIQNMIFKFNTNLLAEESKIGEWDSTQLIEFTPAIKGKFKWVGKDEILFAPSQQLEICQQYEGRLSKNLLKNTKEKKKLDNSKNLKFHTPYLNLESIQAYWGRNENTSKPEIKLATNFNYTVQPNVLLDKLKIEINNNEVGFNINENKASENFNLDIKDRKAIDEPTNITATVLKGLSPVGSNYTTTEKILQTIVLASPYELSVVSATSSFEDGIGIIDVVTSQEIDKESIDAGFTIQPEVETKVELTKNGFKIKGEFAQQIAYSLTINTNLKGILGGKLKADYTNNLFFGEMPPSISFANKKAQFITKKGNQNIGLNIINVPQVELKISKIYQNNILMYMNNMRGYNYEYYDEEGGDYNYESSDYFQEDYNDQYGSVIVNKEVLTKDLPKNKGISLLNVNLNDDKKFKGIYHIKVSSKGDNYLSASKLVSVSDIGILAKQSKNDMMVMVNSLLTSEPLADVDVSLISTNNQNVYTLKTDNKGIAHFSDLDQKASGFIIAMITANMGEDFNFLLLKDNRVETARFETDGIMDNKAGWWAFSYGDRNIYRPGENIYVNTVVRNDNMENIKQVPIIVKLVMPNGKVLQEKRLNTNEQGAAATDFTTSTSNITGTYTIQIYNSNEVLLNTRKIAVEEFVPDKIKVNQTLNKPNFNVPEKVIYTGEALTFFGPPSRNRSYESEFTFHSEIFEAPKYPNYNFAIKSKIKFEPDVRQGSTDENGKFTESFDIPAEWANTGYISGNVFTTVFDENSRPVNRVKAVDIYTQPVFFGVQRHDDWVGTNAPLSFNLLALNKDRNPINYKGATVEVIKYEWQSMLESYYGNYRYNSKPIERVVSSKIVNFADGKAVFSYVPTVSGEYEIRIKQNSSISGYTYSGFYAYQYGSTSSSSFQVNQDGEVIIETDKTEYQNGDNAKLLFKTPFNGKLLVTVDRNKVFEYHVIDITDKSATLELKMKEEYVPNIYISATLIKKANLSDIPLTVAHGLKNITISKTNTKLPVTITAAENSRSLTKQKISVKTEPGAEVTIAVVDEGILSIKNFKTPDPFNYFYQKRALQVESFDLYARLFPELTVGASGGDESLEKRVNPLSVTRFKPVAIWSGVLKANSSGIVEFEANIPKFYGAVRIMAVAYKDQAFGNAEKEMKIFDPIVVSSSLPRFLSPNDEITLGVTMMNTTSKTITANPSITLGGPLELVADNTETYTIEAGKEAIALFNIRAKNDIGKASVNVKVSGAGEVFTDNTDISVRPAAGFQIVANENLLTAGKTDNIALGADFMGTPNIKIIVDNNPLVQLGSKMRELLRYPHGCAEQTISTAFPQLYFSEYAKAVGEFSNYQKLGENELNPNFNINEALKKLNGLASSDGNISYWPGDYYFRNLWLNAYTLHFISEAEKKGFAVNQNLKSRLITLCISQTGNVFEEKDYMRSESGKLLEKNFISREKVFALYVLAAAGSPNRSAMNFCKMSRNKLHNSSRYILASTFALAGDMASYKALVPTIYERENNTYWYGGSFSSPIRDKAMVLNALIEADGSNPQILGMVKTLTAELKATPYTNTNEMAFSLLALGKYVQKNIVPGGKANIIVDGKNVGTFTGKTFVLNLKQATQNISIQNTGNGTVYYSAMYEGISKTGTIMEEDKGLIVRRTFYNRKGESINPANITQNDLIVVKITVQTTFTTGCQNVAVTDILPAGLEIENPRITAAKELDWIKNQTYPEYMDVRDDRINYFLNLRYNQTETMYYMCRAVSKGKFTLGPVQADAMYNGAVHSYFGKGVLVVK